ncbi:hypothetical protein PG993_015090 [Apiospora rasikravindrae]|uniref:Uncharacterized protein n=1 Tax=Apiospora rasikravindrae TaxID=990691 RepID=A0ABR1RPL0_9PEZI
MERLSDPLADRKTKCAKVAFLETITRSKKDIVAFVNSHLGWNHAGEFVKRHIGSLNVGVSVQNIRTQEHALIRFPIPAEVYRPPSEPWLEQRVTNEVMVLNCLALQTTIPVPRVYHWARSASGLLSSKDTWKEKAFCDILKAQSNGKEDNPILDPDMDDSKLDLVYEQIAGFHLQLSRLRFPAIGAISSITRSGDCTVAWPPLTYDMNTVASFTGFPADYFESASTKAPKRAHGYFVERAQSLQINLETHCGGWHEDENITWKRYVARHCLERLVPIYCAPDDDEDVDGAYRLFCDGLGPSNMLADPETMRITALLLGNPAVLANKLGKQRFLDLFEPRKVQYIRAMERAEAASPSPPPKPTGVGKEGRPRLLPLSARVRESWDSGRFWFNLATRSCRDADDIYWRFLHRDGRGVSILDEATLGIREDYLRRKKEQNDTYSTRALDDFRDSLGHPPGSGTKQPRRLMSAETGLYVGFLIAVGLVLLCFWESELSRI